MVERLFGLRRRRAIELLHRFGGFQAGRTFLIDRLRLIGELKAIESGVEFSAEFRRRRKLQDYLKEARWMLKARRVVIETDPEVLHPEVKDLGEGVSLRPGTLHIEFAGTEDLLAKLFHLGQVAANDYDAFQAASEGAGQGSRRLLID